MFKKKVIERKRHRKHDTSKQNTRYVLTTIQSNVAKIDVRASRRVCRRRHCSKTGSNQALIGCFFFFVQWKIYFS